MRHLNRCLFLAPLRRDSPRLPADTTSRSAFRCGQWSRCGRHRKHWNRVALPPPAAQHSTAHNIITSALYAWTCALPSPSPSHPIPPSLPPQVNLFCVVLRRSEGEHGEKKLLHADWPVAVKVEDFEHFAVGQVGQVARRHQLEESLLVDFRGGGVSISIGRSSGATRRRRRWRQCVLNDICMYANK